MSSDTPAIMSLPPKGKGAPPKGLGKGKAPPMKGLAGKAPLMPGGAVRRMPSSESLGPKLRPLFWAAVNQVSSESVYNDLVAPARFDQALLERQFALADTRTPTSRPGSRSTSEEPRKRVRVLDDRTSQMLAIAFNRLPPPERVAEMVNSLVDFPGGLPSEAVLALHNAVTENKDAMEQIKLLSSNPDAIAQLDMPERFLLRLGFVEFCEAKLACGKLIVGSAKELADLRMCGQKVGVCCKDLRKSPVLLKCISTSLAVGNCLNRGTARSDVRGVVLPDALLKLEELRGATMAAECSADVNDKAGSVLDFVAQALVNDAGEKEDDLCKDVENLLAKARAAAGVSLEDTETSCREVGAEATKVRQALNDVPPSPGLAKMTLAIDRICEEAALAIDLSQHAKKQLTKTQMWSCCKGKVKSNEWFNNWAQFLELLRRALARAVLEAKARREEEACRLEACRLADEEARRLRPPLSDVNSTEFPRCDNLCEKCSQELAPLAEFCRCCGARRPEPATSKVSHSSKSKAKGVLIDDDARCDKIDWGKIHELQARAASMSDDKEN